MKSAMKIAAMAAAVSLLGSCAQKQDAEVKQTLSGLDPANFESVYQGDSTALYTLTNAAGMEVCVTNFGGRIVSIMAPDRDGNLRDVVLGFDSVAAYFPENNQSDFGAAIGRYANRIKDGKIELDGVEYQLPRNNYGHCLHGGTDMGTRGWQYRVYNATQPNDSTVVLSIEDADGNNGFPGTVNATVTYTLLADNTLDIKYSAPTDKKTIINLTNHSYFNLAGDPTKPITDDVLTIRAASFTPVDSTYMTSGEIIPVAGTPMDFTTAKTIGQDIERRDYDQIQNGNGYDHNWVLDTAGDDTTSAVTLYSPASGIQMDVYTDEPGIQVYTGNFLDGTLTGKRGITYQQRAAICLETQHYPDSPNKPQWPSVVLNPGETYTSHCAYKFSTK